MPRVRRSSTVSPNAEPWRPWVRRPVRRRAPRHGAGARRRTRQCRGQARPDVPRRSEVAIDRTRAVHADQCPHRQHDDIGTRATVTERWIPVDRRVGLDSRGWRSTRRAWWDERGSGPRLPVPSVVASRRRRTSASATDHPGGSRSAGRRGGVGGRRGAGGGFAGFGGTDTDGAELAPVDMVTGPGNIGVTAAKRIWGRRSASTPRPVPPRSPSWPTTPPTRPCGRRPDQPGRARRAWRPACWSPTASRWATPPTPNSPAQLPATCTGSGSPGADRSAVGHRPVVDDVDAGYGWSTPTPPSTWRSRPSTPPRWAESARPARFRRSVVAGQPGRLLRRVQSRVAHRRVRTALHWAVVQTFLRGIHRGLHRSRAQRRIRSRHHPGQRRGPARPRRGGPSEVRAMMALARRADSHDSRRTGGSGRPAAAG